MQIRNQSSPEDYSPAAHYDRVTHAWSLLLGEELHYGVFSSGDESLAEATRALTRRMLDAARLQPGLKVLDVGCGTGAQSCNLAAGYGVDVLGITTSPVGMNAAKLRAVDAGVADRAKFELRDGTATNLPDESFDRVWILESSHLMRDRRKLVNETARVLRPGGRVVWCDIVRRREIDFLELRTRRDDFLTLRAAFGDARMEPVASYRARFTDAGLVVDHEDDLSERTRQTFDHWRRNSYLNESEVADLIGMKGLAAFRRSCDILEGLWTNGTFGYALLSAAKPDR